MKARLLWTLALTGMLCVLNVPCATGLESENGTHECGANGVLFTNLEDSTDFELSADWGRPCALTLSWTDERGHAQSMTLATPGQPTQGVSSSLAKGGEILWATAPSDLPLGGGQLNWHLERPKNLLDDDRRGEDHRDPRATERTATFGSVGGQFGTVADTAIPCGSGGTLYRNLTGDATVFDLVFTNFNNDGCVLTLTWTDQKDQAQSLVIPATSSHGLSSSLPPGGIIKWSSAGTSANLSISWQVERAVTLPDVGFRR